MVSAGNEAARRGAGVDAQRFHARFFVVMPVVLVEVMLLLAPRQKAIRHFAGRAEKVVRDAKGAPDAAIQWPSWRHESSAAGSGSVPAVWWQWQRQRVRMRKNSGSVNGM